MSFGLSDILSLTGVPGLGAAASAVEMLGAGLNEARIYRQQCKNICTNASTLLAALDEQQKREMHNTAVKAAADEIELVCNSAYKKMQEWRRAGRVKTFLNRDEIRADLERLEKRLESAARSFSITAQMEIVREQEFQRGFAESQMRDMEELKGMLRAMVRDRRDLEEISTLPPMEVQSIVVSVQEELQRERPRTTQSPGQTQARIDLERGLAEIRRSTGILPPLADLTKEVKRIGDAPFDFGLTADIWLGEWCGEQVALKALRNIGAMNEKARKNVLREVEIWRGLQHRHVLRLYGMCYFVPFVYLVSPLAVNGNALRYLELNPEADRLKLLAGAASGLAYLHTRHPPVIHGDLRAANILVLEGGEACISDFGLARLEEVAVNTTNTSSNAAGACRWMAPELINPAIVFASEAKRTTATDVWSFGIASYEIFTGRRPYDHHSMDVHVMQDIQSQWRHPRPHGTIENRGLSDDVWNMMTRCWSQDPARRPKMHEVAALFGKLTSRTGLVSPIRDRSWSQSSSMSDSGGAHRISRTAVSPLTPSFPHTASPQQILEQLPEEEEEIGWISEVMARVGSEASSPPSKLLSPPSITPSRPSFGSADSDRGPLGSASSGSSFSQSPEPNMTSAQSVRSFETFSTTESGSSLHSYDQTALPSLAASEITTTPARRGSGFHAQSAYSTSGSTFSRKSVIEEEEEPDWPSTGPFEIHLSADGKSVETGTLDGVIRLLALSSSSAFRDLRTTFFKIYRAFTDDSEVFDSLCEQYRLAGLSEVSGPRRAKIRYHVIALIKDWIKAQPSVLDNEYVVGRMKTFASSIREPDTLARNAYELSILLNQQPERPRPQRQQSRSAFSTTSGGGELKWSQLTPVEIASQLTAIESELFREITVIDCLVYLQGSNHIEAHGVEVFRDRNRRLSNWIQLILLKCPSLEHRVNAYRRFVQIAAICRTMGNYSSMSAIVVALKGIAIDRLDELKRQIQKDKAIYKQLQESSALLDNGHQAYHKGLENYTGPAIPILHVHLHDIQHNYTNMASYVQGSSGQTLVNFKWFSKLLRRVEALLRYQDSDFTIIDNHQHLRCIKAQLSSSSVQPDPSFDRRMDKVSREVVEKDRKEQTLCLNELHRVLPDKVSKRR